MKEKDLEKNLDNLIIDGLIKEAEQENAEFEAAMRQMSEEDFNDLIRETFTYYSETESALSSLVMPPCSIDADNSTHYSMMVSESEFPESSHKMNQVEPKPRRGSRSKWRRIRPWLVSAVASAAVILIVLIPSINSLDNRLCDSALMASSTYMSASRSANEINALDNEQLKAKLPYLKKRYNLCLEAKSYDTFNSEDLKESGWDLALAYLKLHKKAEAADVLKVLSEEFSGTPFGDHCSKMLEIL